MALTILPRSAWRAKPAVRFTTADPKKWKGSVIHWFGSPRAQHDHINCPAVLRAVQRGHMAPGGLGARRGGSDIGYSAAVCPHGVVYALRGFARQTGANGTREANRDYCALVVMIGEGDRLTGEAKDALRELIAHVRSLGAGLEVRRHGEFTGSACPGPELSAWVNVRAYEKLPPPKKLEPEWLIDVDVPGELPKLRDQDPNNPLVVGRVEAWKKRFGRVSILWKRK